MESKNADPIPGTLRRSSTLPKGPCCSRYVIIAVALILKTPGICCSSDAEAVLIFTRTGSGSEEEGGGAAEEDGAVEEGCAWLLGAVLLGVALLACCWDEADGGAELAGRWVSLFCCVWALPEPVSLGLDSGKTDESGVDSGKSEPSGSDISNDGWLAADAGADNTSFWSLPF